jgi:hypothetical protein
MATPKTFDQVLDAVEELPEEAQAELVAVVSRRLAEQGRKRIIEDVREGGAEFAAGKCRPKTVEEILKELES